MNGGVFLRFNPSSYNKYCLTIDELDIIEEHKTFKGFNDSKRLLHHSDYFNLIEGKNLSVMFSQIWKKIF